MKRQVLSDLDRRVLLSRDIIMADDDGMTLFAKDELQTLQDKYSAASNLYAILFSRNLGTLTTFSGSKKDRKLLEEVIGKNYYYNMIRKLESDDATEEVYIAETKYPFIKVAGVNVVIDGLLVASWVITAVLEDLCTEADAETLKFFGRVTTEEEFYKSVDFLHSVAAKLFGIRITAANCRLDYAAGEFVEHCITYIQRSSHVMDELMDVNSLYRDKLEQYANKDYLTGLYNRRRCEKDLSKIIDDAVLNRRSGALIYIDMDDFKSVNDGLGHSYGDTLLKTVASELRKIEGVADHAYRMGGDEFTVIVDNENINRLDRIIEDIKRIFDKPWLLDTMEYYCSVSMGIVRFPEDGDSAPDAMKKADIAIYEAKKRGKSRVEYYDRTSEASSYKRLDIEKNLRKAIAGGCEEFEIYYQPVFDMQKEGLRKCCGAEALIRWNSKELGFITPDEFVPLAEYLGLINPIGTYVLEKACRDCKRWNDMGFEYKVNVNLSVVQLLQNNICKIVYDTLKKTGLNPKNLTLEVTESLAINDMERMKKILGSIKERGVRIALDDFGTGYSSLNHIKEIPLDVIKVDQCFVSDINKDEYALAFVKMVTELANTINVTVCVEGVDNKEQQSVLRDLNVRLHQGYYYDMPMKVEDFEEKYTNVDRGGYLSYRFPPHGEIA